MAHPSSYAADGRKAVAAGEHFSFKTASQWLLQIHFLDNKSHSKTHVMIP